MSALEKVSYMHINEDARDRTILREYLNAAGYWRTGREITANTGLSSRRIRALGQIFPTLFICGQQGYLLTEHATHAERRECVQMLARRGQKIIDRAVALADTL